MKRTRGLFELFGDDPERADAIVWGRRRTSRRRFVENIGLGAIGAAIGSTVPMGRGAPTGWLPVALADSKTPIKGKDPGLTVLNDRPINAETPAHLLDDDATPPERMFVRNNGHPPSNVDPDKWSLSIAGESAEKPLVLSLADLKKEFKHYSYRLQLECGGNGRKEFYPKARGNQWSTGAIACPEWTGVRLADVLARAGVKKDARYVAYYGADTHLSGKQDKVVISRGVPIAKALEKETLIAWAAGGAALQANHGYPLRLVCGGWPGSVSGKWLTKIVIRNQVHDGPKMGGMSYRVPCEAVAPGETPPESEMCIIESMPVKSLITFPKSGVVVKPGELFEVRGHAWAGDRSVSSVFLSTDFGQTWAKSKLSRPPNRLAWQRFRAGLRLPDSGYYEIWARAVDDRGRSQPMVVPGWNPKGYLNNACHRIAVRVA